MYLTDVGNMLQSESSIEVNVLVDSVSPFDDNKLGEGHAAYLSQSRWDPSVKVSITFSNFIRGPTLQTKASNALSVIQDSTSPSIPSSTRHETVLSIKVKYNIKGWNTAERENVY